MRTKVIFYTLIILFSFSFWSCNKSDKDKGTLVLNFTLTYDGQPLKMYETYTYPNPKVPFQFSRVSFYLTEVQIGNTSTQTEIKDLDYINLTNAHINPVAGSGLKYEIKDIEKGEYNHINFNIGLPSELNSKSPTDYEASNILSNNSEYWPAWASYIYFKCEGLVAYTPDGELIQPVALHLGSDAALLAIELTKSFSITGGQITEVNINIEMKKFFGSEKVYDVLTVPQIHSLGQLPYINELVQNLKTAIN